MSRPFSYNDENFTVIGNILFVHVNIGGRAIAVGEQIIKIPPEIFKRMVTYNQSGVISNKFLSGAAGSLGVTCSNDGFLISRSQYSSSTILPRLFMTWYLLKDI